MTGARAGTKDRLLQAGETLFRRQGYSGAGLKELVKEADAPWGSLYHYFPGGKEQLGAEVMAYAGGLYGGVWDWVFSRCDDAAEAVFLAFRQEAKLLETSDYRNGCPVAATALDVASTSERVRLACNEAFELWTAKIAHHLRAAGLSDAKAVMLADFVMASMEGAIVLSRTAKSPAALLRTGEAVRAALSTELAAARTKAQVDGAREPL